MWVYKRVERLSYFCIVGEIGFGVLEWDSYATLFKIFSNVILKTRGVGTSTASQPPTLSNPTVYARFKSLHKIIKIFIVLSFINMGTILLNIVSLFLRFKQLLFFYNKLHNKYILIYSRCKNGRKKTIFYQWSVGVIQASLYYFNSTIILYVIRL